MKLNDKICKNAKPKEKAYKLADGAGLYLEVAPNGSKYWRLKYYFLKKEKRISFGVYPVITLAEARVKRLEAKRLLAKGINPSEYKKAQQRQQEIEASNTFKHVALDWWETKKAGWTENHAGYTLRRLEVNIFPDIGNLPIHEIESYQVLDALKKTQARGANEVAYRCRSICKQIFDHGIITGKCKENPATALQHALQPYKKSNYTALEIKDIPEFVQTLHSNKARLYPHTLLAVEMLMLTFVRTSELIQATWDEFDLENKLWTIPAERMKMRKEHIVPLSTRVIEILEELKPLALCSQYIFPSQISLRKHMSNNTILKALERMGYKGRMTGHGFRALATTAIQEELHYPFHIVDLQLAHVKRNKVDQAYDRTTFIKERTKMMEDWASYLNEARSGGKVINANFGGVQSGR